MTGQSRKYGDKQSHPIPVWNGVMEHYSKIRGAIWVFLWCLDAITQEKDGVGIVHGDAPVKLERIVRDLKGSKKETVRRDLKSLVDKKYLSVHRTPYGQVIEVLNSKKFNIWHGGEKPQKAVSLGREKPIHEPEKPMHGSEKPQKVVSKEDSAVDSAKRLCSTPIQNLALDPKPKTAPKKVDKWGTILANQGD